MPLSTDTALVHRFAFFLQLQATLKRADAALAKHPNISELKWRKETWRMVGRAWKAGDVTCIRYSKTSSSCSNA